MTSRVGKSDLPTHAWVSARDSGLKCDSLVLCEQIRTLEKRRLRAKAGRIDGMAMARVDAALLCALGIAKMRFFLGKNKIEELQGGNTTEGFQRAMRQTGGKRSKALWWGRQKIHKTYRNLF